MPSAMGRSKRPDSLGKSAGCQIGGDAPLGKLKTAILDRRAHTVARFLDFRVGQADQREGGQATGQMHFNRDFRRRQPRQRP